MSFRYRLIAAFAALAILQAAFFTLLSDQLIRDGIEGEADARLALIGSLFERGLAPRRGPAWDASMPAKLREFSAAYGLDRATLLAGANESWDSRSGLKSAAPTLDRWLADGLRPPQVRGSARVSGPLFRAEDGWHKTLYFRLQKADAWLRIEAGTPFLGAVAAVQKRLFRLALALVLPSLLIGLGLDALLKRLKGERDFSEQLLKGRVSQARHLAFGVAHELRNPLAGMSLMVELLGRKGAEGAPAAELAAVTARIQAEAARVEHTVARFLEFARTPVLSPAPLSLRQPAEEAAAGLMPRVGIQGTGSALADPKACALIFGILLSNACEAAGPQGQVALSLAEGQAKVWDSGEALPEGARERLFTPFFTTKPKGMGLGLATAAGLADAMGGRLSLLDDGKTFELRLPLP